MPYASVYDNNSYLEICNISFGEIVLYLREDSDIKGHWVVYIPKLGRSAVMSSLTLERVED